MYFFSLLDGICNVGQLFLTHLDRSHRPPQPEQTTQIQVIYFNESPSGSVYTNLHSGFRHSSEVRLIEMEARGGNVRLPFDF